MSQQAAGLGDSLAAEANVCRAEGEFVLGIKRPLVGVHPGDQSKQKRISIACGAASRLALAF